MNMELPKEGWTCNPLMPVHVSRGSAVVDLAPFRTPFWDHFGSPVAQFATTLFWSPWDAWVGIVSRFRFPRFLVDFQRGAGIPVKWKSGGVKVVSGP